MFVPLHAKSDYSLGYGTASVDELVEAAATLGYPALALTDLENLYGQVRFHHRCRLRGIRPLTGVEFRPGFDGRREVGRRAGRVVLLAADQTGYRTLCRIVSRRRGAVRGQIPEGTLGLDPLPLVARHPEGLFAFSDEPTVIERLTGSFSRERLGLLLVRPDDLAAEAARREAAARLGIRLIADLDVVFPEAADHSLHALQLAIRQGRLLGEVVSGGDLESRERFLRSPAEAAALFADLPQAITATAEVAEACRLDFGDVARASPGFDLPGATERLRALCEETAAEKVARPWTAAHRRRMDEELSIFESLGFSGFMLVVAEILAHCRREGIPVVARGSAVSSLTLHLLGGSPVDPLAHGLLFERFLHPGKSAWPDVDLDLPWHRRDEVIDWVYRRFGRERVGMVAAHHTFRYRAALREGLKAWGARPALIETLIRALPPEDLAVEDVDFLELTGTAGEGGPMADESLVDHRETAGLGVILPLIQRLVGRPRHIAAHPGGIVVSDRPLVDLLPLERAPKGVVITQYDLVAVARLGLAKIDLLGNRCLSELEEVFELAEGPRPLRLDAFPDEDPQTLTLVDRAETVGCFQLESPAMRSLLARFPVRRHSDLVAALALIRPGAAAGETKTAFVRRARGEESAETLFPDLAERLAESHGLLLYEEDIMVLLSRTGRISLGEADELRAAIVESGGDPAALAGLEADFLARVRRRDTDLAAIARARQAWAAAARFAAYSFSKAHAASYGRLAYLSAYTKAHHPLEFACAALNHHQGLYPLRTLAAEFARRGVDLRGPHVNVSAYHSRLEERQRGSGAGAVRVGLDKVKSLSLRAAGDLLADRTARGPFATLRNLLERVRLSNREISALVLAGAADGLPPLTAADYPFAHEAALMLIREGDLAELDRLIFPRPAPAAADRTRLYQALVRVKNELRYLEMHLLAHPMALLRPEAEHYGCLPIEEAAGSAAGSRMRLAVTIAALRRVTIRQGTMQFLTLEDETGLIEAAALPPAYRRLGERVSTPGPFLVEGKLRRRQGGVHLEVTAITPFHERGRPFGSVRSEG